MVPLSRFGLPNLAAALATFSSMFRAATVALIGIIGERTVTTNSTSVITDYPQREWHRSGINDLAESGK
jgi:hypothetical protein